MAVVHQKPLELAIAVVFVLSICFYSSVSLVHEINKGSFKKFLQGKLFVLTFVDSPTCSRCRVLLPFYVQASQIFPHDPEIFFTRTHDKNLMMDWGVTELPALIYHRDGISNYEVMAVDITVDDIMDQIARVLQGNFAGLSRSYTVHLNDKNYDELIVTPKQNVLLLIYSKPKEEKEVIDTFEKVAYAFRKDDAILFATLDAKKYGLLRDQKFKTRETPAVIWMGQNEKSAPKRFGGILSDEVLVQFVNERTGLNRDQDGSMLADAGRLPEADDIIQNNFEGLAEGQQDVFKNVSNELTKLRDSLDPRQQELLEFYQYIVDSMAISGRVTVVNELIHGIEDTLFGHQETSTKTEENLKRQRNILIFFKNLDKRYAEEKKTRPKDAKKSQPKEQQLKEGDKADTVILHKHVHTEL